MQKKVTRNYRRPKQNLHRSRLGQPRFCHHMVLRIAGLVCHVTYGRILGTNDPKSAPRGHWGTPPITNGRNRTITRWEKGSAARRLLRNLHIHLRIKTDWPNRCMVRSRNLIPEGVGNAHLCQVRMLTKIWKQSPSKFRRNTDRVFATW